MQRRQPAPDEPDDDATRAPAASEAAGPGSERAPASSADETILELREEELVADKHVVQLGLVRIRRRLITETRTIEVPVTREEISIERLPAASSAGTHPDTSPAESGEQHPPLRERLWALQPGQTIHLPIVEEEVLVEKRPRVTQELVIHKRQVEEIRKVSDTVRREELRLAQSGEVQVDVEGATARASAAAPTQPEPETQTKRLPRQLGKEHEDRLELREEELEVGTQVVEVGALHVSTGVVSEQRSLVVRLAREEVVIEQQPVEPRPADPALDSSGETLEIPEYGEQLSLDKMPMVVEEIAIGKQTIHDVQHVTTSVQREELRITTQGDVHLHAANPEDHAPPSPPRRPSSRG